MFHSKKALGLVAVGFTLSSGAAAVQAEVIIDADFDGDNESVFSYAYGGNVELSEGIDATAGVGGSGGNIVSFTPGDGGVGVAVQNFGSILPFAPSALSQFTYSVDLLVEGVPAGNNPNLVARLVLNTPDGTFEGDKIEFQVPIAYDTTAGGFQTLSGTFEGATLREGSVEALSQYGESVDQLQFLIAGDWGSSNPFTADEGLIVMDNPVVEVIPEPASLALLGLGGLAVLRRRR